MTEPILGGKPLKFATPQDLKNAIDKYLEETPVEQYTVTGLALAIGASRQLLLDYEDRPAYQKFVKEAKLIVENSYELSLRKNGRSGDIFALKNFGWKDKTESDINVKGIDPAQLDAYKKKLD